MCRSLQEPFDRAAFMMFLVSEVHPHDDGNGRVGRAAANAELISGGGRRLLIPISFREDYLLALCALSRQGNATPLAECARPRAGLLGEHRLHRSGARRARAQTDERVRRGGGALDWALAQRAFHLSHTT